MEIPSHFSNLIVVGDLWFPKKISLINLNEIHAVFSTEFRLASKFRSLKSSNLRTTNTLYLIFASLTFGNLDLIFASLHLPCYILPLPPKGFH